MQRECRAERALALKVSMPAPLPNYLWRKSVRPEWLRAHESKLIEMTAGALAVIENPGRARVLLETPCRRGLAEKLVRTFGGKGELLARGWLEGFLRVVATKPIRIGRRLMVTNLADQASPNGARILVIPAAAAFGTGEHATTAMSLRLLEEATRRLTSDWRMLDAGTGSGILALAGKCFGAQEVIAVDNDARAISTAKQNAQANQIAGVTFVVGDVTKKISGGPYAIITANLYSELLVAVLPNFCSLLARNGSLILSGVLRAQEPGLKRALRLNKFKTLVCRRRGKWIALVAAHQQKQG